MNQPARSVAAFNAVVYTQVAPKYPATCGNPSCSHFMCARVRENFERRCEKCDQRILVGERFTQERSQADGHLLTQQHEVCPK